MHVVFVASEAVPFAKTGGLGDVVGALPRALARLGHQVTIVLPCYRGCRDAVPLRAGPTVVVDLAGRHVEIGLLIAELADGVRAVLLDQPEYYDRDGLYVDSAGLDYPDNCERFTLLCRGALAVGRELGPTIDCFHLHDWQSGLIAAYLRHDPNALVGLSRRPGCVFTIHNLAFQGNFPAEKWSVLGLDRQLFQKSGMRHDENFSLLKAGIVYGDLVTTVSTTYAQEIQTVKFGCGFDDVLRARADSLVGIVNGIDYEQWDPRTDPAQAHSFGLDDWRIGKRECKRALQRELSLPVRDDVCLLGFVGRLTEQKGIDLLLERFDGLATDDAVQWVVLGRGQPEFEQALAKLSRRFPDKLAARIDFDEPLSRRIYAASDALVMPSQFEPCGLSQLYALRYGTVPVVHAVGGLADTVTDATPANLRKGTATGIAFHHYTPVALITALRRTVALWEQKEVWEQLVTTGMNQQWSWDQSARKYVDIYWRAATIAASDFQP